MDLEIFYDGRKHVVDVKKLGMVGRFFGLMFRFRNTGSLLFDFGKDVKIGLHSFFVFFPFVVLWLDSNNKVLEWRVVRPFCFSILPRKKFRRVVEIPINEMNQKLVGEFL